ncbi:MAG: FtsW/RodA/SpoVE family cell cycle protein [Bacteroidales bacterium]|nr:FtsW/RodA/SpoVE family cell cycle protein [Bacteroidales bacterium]
MKNLFAQMKGDKVIWFILFFLGICSMVLIYSAASNQLFSPTERHNLMPFVRAHGMFVLLGWLLAFLIQFVDYRKIAPFSRIAWLLALGLLLYTLIFGGSETDIVRRSVTIFGRQIQTFYIVVFLAIIYMANELAHAGTKINNIKRRYLPFLGFVGSLCLLLMSQNVSTSLILLFTTLFMLFISDLGWKPFWLTVGVLVAVVLLLVATSGFHIGFLSRFATVHARVERFFNAPEDTKTYVENMTEAEVDNIRQDIQLEGAVSTGGYLPVNGPGNSIYSNMPQSYSDCIFAIAVEEYGVIIGALLLSMYLILFYRIFLIIQRTSNAFGAYLAGGLGFWITLQAFMHISVCVGVMPNTGQTLPLVSWGNVSIVITSICFGIILNISKTKNEKTTIISEGEHE